MDYAKEFLTNSQIIEVLVEEGGFQIEPTKSVIEEIGKLCAIVVIVEKAIEGHTSGETLPLRFETELDISPIKTVRRETFDIIKEFEDTNIIVPLRDSGYRIMLSSLMNTLFTLTAEKGEGTIRNTLLRINNPLPFEEALEKIEWELIRNIHENIDIKYLDLSTLAEKLTPNQLAATKDASFSILEVVISDTISRVETERILVKSIDKLRPKEEDILQSKKYVRSIVELSEVFQKQAATQWGLMQDIASYPRSFLARKREPLIKSSWSLNPDFRLHPLMIKFQELIRRNHSSIAELVSSYQEVLSAIISSIPQLPKGSDILSVLRKKDTTLPEEEKLESCWKVIEKHCSGLNAQVSLMSSMVASMDALFDYLSQS